MTSLRFSDLEGQRIAVWGVGAETRSLAQHLQRLSSTEISVLVLEDPDDDPRSLGAEVGVVVGPTEAADALSDCHVLVRSPGVSIYRPELQALSAHGVRTTTATALWLAERQGRNVLGITATKGKSTTASLAAHLIASSGQTVQLAGNIGRPALDLLDAPSNELVVLELSSYQIADLEIGPQVAMATNLYREHLNWHLTMDAYRHDKLRLLTLPGVERCVVNGLSADVMAAKRTCVHSFVFGVAPGWRVERDGLAVGERLAVRGDDLPLIGPHNALNICGALTALDALDLDRPSLPEAFEGFAPLPHRLQVIHQAAGVTWVDDSISTTPESALMALDSFPSVDIVYIGGGVDRGQDYGELGRQLAARGAHVIGLPVTGGRLLQAVAAAGLSTDRSVEAPDLPTAVNIARSVAATGTVVLLSPAAPSFHQYRDFEERGDHFAALAREPGATHD